MNNKSDISKSHFVHRYTNRTIERSSFFKHLMRKAARGVLSTGRGLYRFFSRFVVDTFYSMAVTTASIAILRFCIIEILMENDIEYESLLSNGIISFSRLPSYKNVHQLIAFAVMKFFCCYFNLSRTNYWFLNVFVFNFHILSSQVLKLQNDLWNVKFVGYMTANGTWCRYTVYYIVC